MRPTITFAAVALLFVTPAVRAGGSPEEALRLARKLTTEGAATFDTKNARAMAAYYTEDARLFVMSKDRATDEVQTQEKRGRDEIEGFYQSVFKGDATFKARNTVEFARLIGPDVLLIGGVFEPNTEAADPLKVPFLQVRVRQGDRWLMDRLQIFLFPGP